MGHSMSEDPSKKTQDKKLFREMMHDASPLKQDKIKPWHKRLPPHPLRHAQSEQGEMQQYTLSETEIETGDELAFSRPSSCHGVLAGKPSAAGGARRRQLRR